MLATSKSINGNKFVYYERKLKLSVRPENKFNYTTNNHSKTPKNY